MIIQKLLNPGEVYGYLIRIIRPNWEWGTPGFGIVPTSGYQSLDDPALSNYPDNDSSFVESVCYKNENNTRKILRLKYWARIRNR